MNVHTHCRLCEGACGLIAEVEDDVITSLSGDPSDPVSEGFICSVAQHSLQARAHPERFTQPMRRTANGLQPASWDEAINDIGSRLQQIRADSGARSLGVYLGEAPWWSTPALARTMAFTVGMGTPNLFSELAMGAGPMLRVTEMMIGWPAPLLSDLGRAHYVLLLDSEQTDTDWGPWQAGMAHPKWIAHSRRTKKSRLAVASPRATATARDADTFLAIRPGTEPFLLLGLLSAIVSGGRHDQQYVRDYTRGWDQLAQLLAPWPVDRCARICGVDAAQIAGVSLRFARAAMAVAHPSRSTFTNAQASVGAWAWLTLHAVTANLLRPGGLYDHEAPFDLYPLLTAAKAKGAPRTRVAQTPLMALQAPATLLTEEVLTPGQGQIRALVTIAGDPASHLPDSERIGTALDQLDLLVCLARQPDATTARADWVLPLTHPWEQDHLHVHETALLPTDMTAWTPALVPPVGQARHTSDILRDLYKAAHPGIRGSSWGIHLRLLARWLATTSDELWQNKQVNWFLNDAAGAALMQPPNRYHPGDTDRSPWRVDMPDERIDLVPEAILPLMQQLTEPTANPDFPLWLRTSGRVDRAPDAAHRVVDDPGLRVHPDAGIPDGASVRVRTRHGVTTAIAHHDPTLRPDVADLPFGYTADPAALLSASSVDPLTGTPQLDGLPCRVEFD